MDLTHSFEVPTTIEQAWDHFNDIEAIAECFPGAQVTSVEGHSFTGQVKVRLGPIALVYLGSGTIVERDDSAHRMVVEAKGKDKRGNGTAGASAVLTMSAVPGGGTAVEVVTALSITGKPAQFGRGVMQDVSDKLLGQFVACLEERLGPETPTAAEGGGPAAVATPATPATTASAAQEPPDSPRDSSPGVAPGAQRGADDDTLDLGATVVPVLARAYWKQAVAVVLAVLVLRRLLGWRARRR